MYSLIKGKHGIKYAVKITNRFTALEKIDESNDNVVDKQWGNVCENRRKSRLVFVRGTKINRGDECVKIAKIPNEEHIIWLTQNTVTMNLVLNHHQMRKILDHKKLFGNQYPRQIIVVIALKKEIALNTPKNPTLSEIISDIFDYTNIYALQCDLAKPICVSANGIEHAVFLCPFTYYQDLKLVSEIRDKSVCIVNTTIVNKSNLEANTNNSEVMYSLQKVRPILNNLVQNFNCIPLAEYIIQFKGSLY
ncbi:piggyBac transposable element-derived protein 3-like [Vespula maculifrons]|uniref:PiggyBac transposable element-derived protein 3-like n=1 Tax=Vespula maculifrons TaxID=7453 RepID=A0ABD2CVR3_VESMC